METSGVDVLLIIDPGNLCWLTGYMGESAYVPQMLILAGDEAEPELVLRHQDVPCAVHSAYMAKRRYIAYPEELIADPDGRDGFDFVIERLQERRLDQGRIGIEKGSTFLSGTSWEKFQTSLPDATWVDVTGVLNRLRSIKSAQEIAYMR